MRKNSIIVVSFFLIISLLACGGEKTPGKEPPAAEEHEEHRDLNTTNLTAEQVRTIGIEFGAIEQKQLTASLKTNGVLRVPNQNKASVNSVYSGVIKSLLVQPGNFVKKGEVIATIANPEFIRVQSDYLNVEAKIHLAELEVKRQSELNAGNAGALKNLQAAETELRTLQTARASYEQQIRLMGVDPSRLTNNKLVSVLSITSPIAGVVSDVKVQMGSFVDVSTAIADIVDNSQLHLDLFVYEKDLPRIQNNQLIHFTLTNSPGKEYDAQIYSLGASFEDESKAVTIHARVLGDKAGLIDGMNITAVISLEKATVAAVPTSAIVSYQGRDYIFFLKEETDGTNDVHGTGKQAHVTDTVASAELVFERVPVARGTTDVGYTEITVLNEIPKDAKIVVQGAFFVMAKMTNTGEHED
jgi:RND family efflux transporter MFP subunit